VPYYLILSLLSAVAYRITANREPSTEEAITVKGNGVGETPLSEYVMPWLHGGQVGVILALFGMLFFTARRTRSAYATLWAGAWLAFLVAYVERWISPRWSLMDTAMSYASTYMIVLTAIAGKHARPEAVRISAMASAPHPGLRDVLSAAIPGATCRIVALWLLALLLLTPTFLVVGGSEWDRFSGQLKINDSVMSCCALWACGEALQARSDRIKIKHMVHSMFAMYAFLQLASPYLESIPLSLIVIVFLCALSLKTLCGLSVVALSLDETLVFLRDSFVAENRARQEASRNADQAGRALIDLTEMHEEREKVVLEREALTRQLALKQSLTDQLVRELKENESLHGALDGILRIVESELKVQSSAFILPDANSSNTPSKGVAVSRGIPLSEVVELDSLCKDGKPVPGSWHTIECRTNQGSALLILKQPPESEMLALFTQSLVTLSKLIDLCHHKEVLLAGLALREAMTSCETTQELLRTAERTLPRLLRIAGSTISPESTRVGAVMTRDGSHVLLEVPIISLGHKQEESGLAGSVCCWDKEPDPHGRVPAFTIFDVRLILHLASIFSGILETEKKDARRASRLKQDIHEMKQPLASVRQELRWIEINPLADTKEVRGHVRDAQRDIELMLGILGNSSRAVSNIDDGLRRHPDDATDKLVKPIHPLPIVRHVCDSHHPSLFGDGVDADRVSFEWSQLKEVRLVFFPEGAFREIMYNLVSNAVKYRRRETRSLRMRFGYQEDADYHKFSVEDDGIGVDNGWEEKIFEKEARSPRARAQASGLGLGLPSAREVAREHGGELLLDSPREPTRFVLRIPR